MRIFLIGMPGSGKSTIGRYLAESLNLPLFDLDKLIEQSINKSITELFDEVGENGFRQLEKEILDKLIADQARGVISAGGGTPCFYDNLKTMKEEGKTIYIDVPLETLVARTERSSKRPLLQGNPREKIEELLKSRQDIYRQADIVILTKGRESLDVAREITDLFERFRT